MVEFFKNGGFGMWPVLVFGLITVATAGYYAFRAQAQVKGFIEWMSRTVLFASLTGTITGIATTLGYVTSDKCPRSELTVTTMMGIRESLSNAIMGFAFLTVIFLLTAIGQRRLDAKS